MNLTILKQSLQQMWGIILLDCKYNGHLPDINNYHTTVKYSLPFRGQWVVANGGVTQDTSHSWDIPTQRYAYDFFILDESDESYQGDETCPSSFYCYGQDILAPADGIIVEMQNNHPDSICVKLGDRIKRGEKIAECGNTGNTSEPHLHFQIQSTRSFFTSPGLPIEFDNITVTPFPDYEKLDGRKTDAQTHYPPYLTRGESVENNIE